MVFPLSGIVWLFWFKRWQSADPATTNSRTPNNWILMGAMVGFALLAAVWLPGRAYSLIRPKDLKSVTVELSRGPCYGRCASYRIVIHGTGSVEYVGYANVRIRDRQMVTLSNEQVTRILRELDRSHFFSVEDRAFEWCFDTPSVEISVSMDGRTKRVSSDAGCTGTKFGTQAKFVQVANAIDAIVGTQQWVKCDGHCTN